MPFEEAPGLITNIQRFSLDDGPGVRTTVFLKGCSLACRWCHNPETISTKRQIQYQEGSCKSCGRCVAICKSGAHRIEGGRHVLNWDACAQCLNCVEACAYGALSVAGREITVEALGEQLLRDQTFYNRSGGGITLSGGEPLLQPVFSAGVFRYVKEKGVHTALDTAGNVPWSSFETVLPWVDLVLFDIKLIDPRVHQEKTGVQNQLILENFKRLLKEKVAVWVRTPLMMGINNGDEETDGRIRVLLGMKNVRQVELLPFHRYGIGKYASLGMSAGDFDPPLPEELTRIKSRMEAGGIRNVIT